MSEDRSIDPGAREIEELNRQLAELRAENVRLRELLGVGTRDEAVSSWEPSLFVDDGPLDEVTATAVDRHSPREAKITLFRSLFVGREDVHALRWENSRTAKAGWSPAVRGGWANAKKPGREYLPFSNEVLGTHLAGEVHAGIYPLLKGDACRFLACDFDGTGWVLDALAYLDAARAMGVPVALERSRSGNGAHVWAVFSGPVPASVARQIGAHLLREAMTIRAELDLASYDRLFPAQDFVPKGSFGNLIALPLNGECRKRGTTVFLDPSTLEPFEDQWAFLSTLDRLSPKAVTDIARSIPPIGAGPDDATYRRPSTSDSPQPPEKVMASVGAMISIERIGIPPALLTSLKHAASLHNPAYYEKERLRFSTWNTPRFVRCYGESFDRLLIPRGLRQQVEKIVSQAGSRLELVDGCPDPEPVHFAFAATLTKDQRSAFDALAGQDLGVLVAPPGSGKTVIACAVIAHHQVPALVVVDRQPLVDQWRERLVEHLGLDKKQIGQLGGGRGKTHGIVDIAMAQSLARREDLAELGLNYGLAVVDECHHVPAVKKQRAEVIEKLGQGSSGGGLLLVATGGLLGEGFDCPPLDTLFLAFPLAFKGRLVQYVGRVMRPLAEKTSIEVHDYVDVDVPVLARMHGKRLAAYASLGFDTKRRSG